MIIPGSSAAVFIILMLGMLGWGLWANPLKAAGDKWRFELFCFDFAIGVALSATVLALTLGSLGFDGFSFWDELGLAGKRQDLFAFIGGGIFNLGNMLLLGAVSVAGMALTFPAAMGFALVIGAFWNFAMNPGGRPVFLFGGAAVVLAAVVLDAFVFKSWAAAKRDARIEQGKTKSKKSKTSLKAIFLCLAGGLFIGSYSPFVQMARTDENGLGPYSLGFFFAMGILLSTIVFNLFFMNLPVKGDPVEILQYFRSKTKQHILGILGGILWYGGMIARLVAARADVKAQVREPIAYAMTQAAMVIAALCGLYVWRELDGAPGSAKSRFGLVLVLLVAGIALSAFGLAPAK